MQGCNISERHVSFDADLVEVYAAVKGRAFVSMYSCTTLR